MLTVLTPGERRALTLVLFLVLTGLATQFWLRSRPPRELPPLPLPVPSSR
ncbi:MAG: hypothetical protein KF791_00145 [Verrucomicrobiae bacterium]|nr:hypothetical protein [Verrucomicrobiae bacterium]